MEASENIDDKDETHLSDTQVSQQTKRARGAPRDNGNALQSGVYTLIRLMKEGALDGRSALAKWRKGRIAEYVSDLGGESEVSTAQRGLVEDIVDCEVIAARARDELYGIKRLYRKGRAHPLIDVFFKAIAQIREGRKLLGIKRVPRQVPTLTEYLHDNYGHDESDEKEQQEQHA